MFSCRKLLFLVIQIVLLVKVFCNVTKETAVSTKIGTFIGQTELVDFNGESKYVQRFLGIPYAKPPVGERRFLRPEPFGTFSQPYNATFHRPHCLQVVPPYYMHLKDFEKSEDCLYLNVFVPGNLTSAENKYAVMIYIHGGSFALGGADIYSGDNLATFNDVIVVTINYRLNVFGFLSNGTKSSGNFGLWDMKMAIKWVNDHIDEFGGDYKRVTLFGNSAGGAAVMYQSIFPGNKDLFKRAISQSGSAFSPWAFQKNPSSNFIQYTNDIGCNVGDYEEIRQCLLNKPAEDLQVSSWVFVPSIDRDFLWEEPTKLFSPNSLYGKPVRKFFAGIDYMNGVVSSEGAMNIPEWTENLKSKNLDINEGVPRYYFKDVYITERLATLFGDVSAAVKESVIQRYTDWSRPNDPAVIRQKMIDIASDTSFYVPLVNSAKKHSTTQKDTPESKSYFYLFDHKPSFIPEPDWLQGADHTMEVPYVFGLHEALEGKLIYDQNAVDPLTVTSDEIQLSRVMMTMWTNFAKSGNPNSPVDPGTVEWPMFDNDAQRYLELTTDMTSQSVKHHFAATQVAFWNDLVPILKECNQAQITSDAPISSSSLWCFMFSLYLGFLLV